MAHNLGVTLDTLYNMSSKEYFGWVEYFRLRPIGWREDHRTAIVAQTTYQGKKPLDIESLFPSLKVFKENDDANIKKAKNFLNQLQSRSQSKNKIKLKD